MGQKSTRQVAGVEDLVEVQSRKGPLLVRNDDDGVASRDGGREERHEAEEGSVAAAGRTDDADDADRLVDTDDGAVKLRLLNDAAVLKENTIHH